MFVRSFVCLFVCLFNKQSTASTSKSASLKNQIFYPSSTATTATITAQGNVLGSGGLPPTVFPSDVQTMFQTLASSSSRTTKTTNQTPRNKKKTK